LSIKIISKMLDFTTQLLVKLLLTFPIAKSGYMEQSILVQDKYPVIWILVENTLLATSLSFHQHFCGQTRSNVPLDNKSST